MSLDLGGPAIEIAIALAFVFFLLSLIVSQVNELIAGALKLRAKNLRKGLKGMFGDESVVERLLDHPLIRTDLGQDKRRDPPTSRRRTSRWLCAASLGRTRTWCLGPPTS